MRACAIMAFTACGIRAQDILKNPGFDSTVDAAGVPVPAIWRMSTGDTMSYAIACDIEDKHSGFGAARIRVKKDATTLCCHYDQRLADTLVGHQFHVTAWIKASAAIVNNAQLVIQVGDTRNGGWRQVQWQMLSGFNVTEWTQVDRTVSLSPDGNRVVFTIYVKPNQPAGTTIWVDEMTMTDLSTGVVYHPLTRERNGVTRGSMSLVTPLGRRVPAPGAGTPGLLAPGCFISVDGKSLLSR
jgi:hypothetical protein